MFRDLENNLKIDQVIDPVVLTADADGASVDLQDYEKVAFLALVGESGDTLGSGVRVELEVEESDDDSSFTDVADADLQTFVAGVNDGCFSVIDAASEDDVVAITTYRGSSRYVRPVVNLVGTHTNGIPIGIVAVRMGKNEVPVS